MFQSSLLHSNGLTVFFSLRSVICPNYFSQLSDISQYRAVLKVGQIMIQPSIHCGQGTCSLFGTSAALCFNVGHERLSICRKIAQRERRRAWRTFHSPICDCHWSSAWFCLLANSIAVRFVPSNGLAFKIAMKANGWQQNAKLRFSTLLMRKHNCHLCSRQILLCGVWPAVY